MMEINVVATTDIHGYLDEGLENLLKYPRFNQADLKIDNGDFFTGSPFASFGAKFWTQTPLVQVANRLAYDVMVMGNHDLDYGLDWLREQVNGLSMPYLAANVFDLDKTRIFQAYYIKEIKGYKVAVIGLVNEETRQSMPIQYTLEIIIASPLEIAKQIIEEIKDQVDLILIAYHGGLIKDLVGHRQWTYDSIADQGHLFVENFSEISGLICGHQHFIYHEKNAKGVAIIQPGSHGRYLGEISIHPKLKQSKTQVYSLSKKSFPIECRQRYDQWMLEKVDIRPGLEKLEKIFPANLYLCNLNHASKKELWGHIQEPFSLKEYILSENECQSFLNIQCDHALENSMVKVIATPGELPEYRCRRDIIFPLFDVLVNTDKY